jgi:hypothetical protein
MIGGKILSLLRLQLFLECYKNLPSKVSRFMQSTALVKLQKTPVSCVAYLPSVRKLPFILVRVMSLMSCREEQGFEKHNVPIFGH